MIKRRIKILLIALLVATACTSKKSANLVIKGGRIYTVNSSNDVVEGIAVTGDRITFVGSNDEVTEYIDADTEVIELGGKTLTPGLIEGHGHLMGVGYNELNLNLSDVRSYDEMIEQVKRAVAKSEPGEWIVGRGWHQDKWEVKPEILVKGFPVHKALSDVSPDNPVFLRHASGHAAFANSKAMEVSGVNTLSIEKYNSEEGEGGEVIRDSLGNPTGLFNERAMNLINDVRQLDELGVAVKK